MLYGRRVCFQVILCFAFALFAVIFGCRHVVHHPLAEHDIYFESIEYESALDWITRHGNDVETYIKTDFFREFCRNLGYSEDEINRILTDRFVRRKMTTYTFQSPSPGKKLAQQVLNFFTRTGWKIRRDILFPEETNCGGDWLRVFEKDGAQIHVHIMGPMDSVPVPEGIVIPRMIMFKFHNYSPRSFFPKQVSELIDQYYTNWESPDGEAQLIPHYGEDGNPDYTEAFTSFPLPAVAYTNVTLEVCVEDYTHFAKHLLLKIYKRPETRCEVPFSIAVMKNPERLKRQQTVFIPESCVSNAMRHIAESYGVKVRRDGTSGYFLFYDGKE